jgi:hypothetical protein
MIVVTTPLGTAALLSLLFLSVLFANLSRRLGAVTKVADHHRWFTVAQVCIGVAGVSQLIRGSAGLAPDLALPFLLKPWFALVSFHMPLAVGVTVCLGLVWYYWGWIVREQIK